MTKTVQASRYIRRSLIASLLAATFGSLQAAEAVAIDIGTQPLGAALAKFSEQSSIKAVYPAELLAGKTAPAISGRLSPQQALDKLLAGSGLAYRFVTADAVRIEAVAQPDATARPHQLADVVVSATRTANPIDQVAASISVVNRDDIEEAQAGSVSQVLKKLPNVEFGGGPRVNGEIPTIRGVSGASIGLLVDGARQNDTTSPSIKSPLFLDPYFLQQVEVLRGAASSLYGTGGNGGVMAFTTYSARDLLNPGQSLGGGAKLAYGDADNSTRINARLYGGNDVADALIALGSHSWGRIRQGGGSHLDPNDGESSTGLVKLGVQPLPGGRIELSHQFYKSENLQVNNAQATDYRVSNLPLDKPAIQRVHVDQGNTVLKGTLGDVDGTPAVAATLYQTSLQYEFDRSPDPAITNVLYSNTKTVTDGATLQGSHLLDGGTWGRHRLTGGIEWFKDKQTAIAATAANPSASSTVTRNGTRQVTGIFAQDEIALGGGWRLTPSLRSDHYEASLADGTLPSNSASRVSPKLMIAWQDGAGLMLYGNVGEAFRAPTVGELYQNFTSFGLSNFLPNANLKPEIDRTLEIGANFKRKALFTERDSIRWRAALFNSQVTDLIYSVNLGGMTPTGSSPAQQATFATNCANTGMNCKFQWQNVANAKRTGGELEGSYAIDNWQFNAAYSRVRVENRDSGTNLFSPPDKLGLQVRRQFPAQGITAFWNATRVAAQDYDSTVLRRRPAYTTHDIFASWTPAGQKFRLDLGVTNLFDKRYSAYQSSNAYANTYQEGRSLRAAVSVDF